MVIRTFDETAFVVFLHQYHRDDFRDVFRDNDHKFKSDTERYAHLYKLHGAEFEIWKLGEGVYGE